MLKRAVLLVLTLVVPAARSRADAASDQAYKAGAAAYAAADYQGAIKQAEAAVAADPNNWQAWQLDGNARYALGDKAGAVTVYKYALQINPGNAQLKTFVDSLEQAPAPAAAAASPAEASYQAGVAHYTAADYDSAMKEAAEAVRADPNHWQAWALLGNCRYARNDKHGALEAYDKSLALHPDQSQLKAFVDTLRPQVSAEPAPASTAMAAPAATAIAEPESTVTSSRSMSDYREEPGRWSIGPRLGMLTSSSGLGTGFKSIGVEGGWAPMSSLAMTVDLSDVLIPSTPGSSGPQTTIILYAANIKWLPFHWPVRPYLVGGYGSMTLSVAGFALSIGLVRFGAGLEYVITPNFVASLDASADLGHVDIVPIGFTEYGLSVRYCFGPPP